MKEIAQVSFYQKLHLMKGLAGIAGEVAGIGMSTVRLISLLSGANFQEWREWQRRNEMYKIYHKGEVDPSRGGSLGQRLAELYTLYKSKVDQGDEVFLSGHSLGGIVISALQNKISDVKGATFNEGAFFSKSPEGDIVRHRVQGDVISATKKGKRLRGTQINADHIYPASGMNLLARHSLSNFIPKEFEIAREFEKHDLWTDRAEGLRERWGYFVPQTERRLRDFTESEYLIANFLRKTHNNPVHDDVWKVEVLDGNNAVIEMEITNLNAHTPPIGMDSLDTGRGMSFGIDHKKDLKPVKAIEAERRREHFHLEGHKASAGFLERRQEMIEDVLENKPSESTSALIVDLCTQIDLWEEFKEKHYGEPIWIDINRKCSFFRECLLDAILQSVKIIGIVSYVKKRQSNKRRKFMGVMGVVPYEKILPRRK